MQNKNILVVGGSSGIGLALCQQCCDRGNIVYNISRTACPTASVKNFCADVTDVKALARAFDKLPDVDVMFYCAGTSLAAPVESVTSEDMRKVTDTNLVGAMECCRLAVPKMRGGGKIVLLSSVGAIVPIAYDSFYSASKAGMNMFARAFDLENKHISCTAAVIGGVKTQFSFKRKIYDDANDAHKNLARAAAKLIRIEQRGYTASEIAAALVKTASKNTPPVVNIGAKTKLLMCAYKLLPPCVKQALEKHIFEIE